MRKVQRTRAVMSDLFLESRGNVAAIAGGAAGFLYLFWCWWSSLRCGRTAGGGRKVTRDRMWLKTWRRMGVLRGTVADVQRRRRRTFISRSCICAMAMSPRMANAQASRISGGDASSVDVTSNLVYLHIPISRKPPATFRVPLNCAREASVRPYLSITAVGRTRRHWGGQRRLCGGALSSLP